MMEWNKIAGGLTAFGLTGLALSPFILTPAVSAPSSNVAAFAVAVSAGPQLRLLPAGAAAEAAGETSTEEALVCGRVFRLAFADVGFSCRSQSPPDVAAATDRLEAFATSGRP